MTRTVTSLEAHSTGILNALSTLAFPTGDGVDPERGGQAHNPPYAVLYVVGGGLFDGPLNDSQADVTLRFQITSVGATQTEALRILDQTRARMQKEYITVTGRSVRNVTQITTSGGTRRDDDIPTPLFYAYDLWELDTTPAA